MARNVAHSLKQLESGINGYVYGDDQSAYLGVAVVLRKLLLDKNSANSFQQQSDNIVQLYYGSVSKIYLREFGSNSKQRKWINVLPPLYHHKSDVIFNAVHRGKWVSLNRWLEEPIVPGDQGQLLTTSDIVKFIADKQGAHIIRRKGRTDVLGGPSIALAYSSVADSEIDTVDFEVPWQQFIIASGVKFLHALKSPGKVPLILHHNVVVPRANIGLADTLQTKKRPWESETNSS